MVTSIRGDYMEIQLWREILSPYQLAVDELVVKFNHIIQEYRSKGQYSPIEQVVGRVKKISSILDKMNKKNLDIDKVVEIIRNRKDMEIKCEKDYISNYKDSGYRSYHIIVYYDVYTLEGTRRLQAEIQIRTMAMNFWATIEHSLQYKYHGNMPMHVRERLYAASEAIVALDSEMSSVRDEIIDAQNSFTIKANMISDILVNIQNLYQVANKREVLKIQEEFYQIFATQDLEQLERFCKELDIIAEGYKAQSLS